VYGVVRQPHEFVEELVDKNIPALGPPESLLEPTKRIEAAAEADDVENPMAVAWDHVDFAERYRAYLQRTGTEQVLASVREDLAEGDVWLVCYEKDPTHCHRRLLADYLLEGRTQDPIHHPEPSTGEESRSRNGRLSDYAGGDGVAH